MCNEAFDAACPPFEAACQGYDKDHLLDYSEDAWGAFRAIDDLAEVASTQSMYGELHLAILRLLNFVSINLLALSGALFLWKLEKIYKVLLCT